MQDNNINQLNVSKIDGNKYRYICDRCMNDEIRTSNIMVGVTINCPSCRMPITLKKENFIAI